jgi:hypothetical protein
LITVGRSPTLIAVITNCFVLVIWILPTGKFSLSFFLLSLSSIPFVGAVNKPFCSNCPSYFSGTTIAQVYQAMNSVFLPPLSIYPEYLASIAKMISWFVWIKCSIHDCRSKINCLFGWGATGRFCSLMVRDRNVVPCPF